jgi:hypothetical protein
MLVEFVVVFVEGEFVQLYQSETLNFTQSSDRPFRTKLLPRSDILLCTMQIEHALIASEQGGTRTSKNKIERKRDSRYAQRVSIVVVHIQSVSLTMESNVVFIPAIRV